MCLRRRAGSVLNRRAFSDQRAAFRLNDSEYCPLIAFLCYISLTDHELANNKAGPQTRSSLLARTQDAVMVKGAMLLEEHFSNKNITQKGYKLTLIAIM